MIASSLFVMKIPSSVQHVEAKASLCRMHRFIRAASIKRLNNYWYTHNTPTLVLQTDCGAFMVLVDDNADGLMQYNEFISAFKKDAMGSSFVDARYACAH